MSRVSTLHRHDPLHDRHTSWVTSCTNCSCPRWAHADPTTATTTPRSGWTWQARCSASSSDSSSASSPRMCRSTARSASTRARSSVRWRLSGTRRSQRSQVRAGDGKLGPAGLGAWLAAGGRLTSAQPAHLRLVALALAAAQHAHRPRGQAGQAAPAAQHPLGDGVPCGDARGPGRRAGEEPGADGVHLGRLGGGAHPRVSRGVGRCRTSRRSSAATIPTATKVFVNGMWVGIHHDPDALRHDAARAAARPRDRGLRSRRSATLPLSASCGSSPTRGGACGRMFVVDRKTERLLLKKDHIRKLRSRGGRTGTFRWTPRCSPNGSARVHGHRGGGDSA